jgi:TP901 family phage tail tape measure protein
MAANPFVLTAQLRVTGPVGINQVVGRVQRQVNTALAGTTSGTKGGSVTQTVAATRSVTQASKQFAQQTVASTKATKNLNSSLAQSSRRFSTAIRDVATLTGGMLTLHGALIAVIGGFKSLVSYQRQLGAMAQITRTSTTVTAGLGKEMRKLSKQYGISTELLGKNAIELLQAGRSMQQVKEALPTLALLGVNAQVGAEGLAEASKAMIVWQNTFKQTQAQTTQSFEKVVALAKRQFISVSELIEGTTILSATAKSSGASFEEMISIIASTKSQAGRPVTEVARALNTLMSRVVSDANVKKMKDFGIEVFDDKGVFRGIFDVARDLRAVRDAAGEASERAIKLDVMLGGIRRRSLAGSFLDSLEEAEANLRAISGNVQELEKDWGRVANTMGIKLGTTLEYVRDAFLEITETENFRELVDMVLELVKGFSQLAAKVKDLVPYLLMIGTAKLGVTLAGAGVAGIFGRGSTAATVATAAAVSAQSAGWTRGAGGTSPFGPIKDKSGFWKQPAQSTGGTGYAGISQRNALPNRRPFSLPMMGAISGRQALGLGLLTGAATSMVPTQGEGATTGTRGFNAALTGATGGLFAFAAGLNPVAALLGGAAIALKQFINTTNEAKTKRSVDIAQKGIEAVSGALNKNDPRALGRSLADINKQFQGEKERLTNQRLSPKGALAGLTQLSGIGLAAQGVGKMLGFDTSSLSISDRDAEGVSLGFSALGRSIMSLGRKDPLEAAEEIQREDREKMRAAQQALAPQVLQGAQQILDKNPQLANIEEFKEAEGGQAIVDFINGMQEAGGGVYAALLDMIEGTRKAREALQEFSDVTSRLAQSQFIDALIARRTRATFDTRRVSLREREDQRTGNIRSRLTGRERIGTAGFARSIEEAPLTAGSRGILNRAQTDFNNLSDALRALDGDINNMMSENPDEGFNAILSDPSISEGVRDALKEMILSIPGADAEVGSEAFFKRQDAIAQAFANIYQISDELVKKANPEAFGVLGEGLGLLDDSIRDIVDTFTHASDKLTAYVTSLGRAGGAQLAVMERQSQFNRNRPLGGGFANQTILDQVERLTGGTANTQFIGQRLRDLDAQREAVRGDEGLSEEERAQQLGALDTAANQLISSLKLLSDSTTRLRGYQDDLARAQQGLSQKYGVAEEFIVAGQEGRMQMIRDASAAQAVVQRGTFQGVPDEIAQAAVRHLNRFGGIEGAGGLGGAQGFTGEEIKQALLQASIGGGFFAPEMGAERAAQENIIRVMQDAANAEWELARYQEQVFNRFADRLDDVFDNIAGASGSGDRFPFEDPNNRVGPTRRGQPGVAQPPAVMPGPGLPPQPNFFGEGGMVGMGAPDIGGGRPTASSVIGGGGWTTNRAGERVLPLEEQRSRRRAQYEAQKQSRALQNEYRRRQREGLAAGRTQQAIDQNFQVRFADELQSHQFNRMRAQGFSKEQAFAAAAEQRLQNAQAANLNPASRNVPMENVWNEILQSFREIFDVDNIFGEPGEILGPLQERFFGATSALPQQPGAQAPGVDAQAQLPQGPDPNQQAFVDGLNAFNDGLANNMRDMSQGLEQMNAASDNMRQAADQLAQAMQDNLTLDQNLNIDVNVNGSEEFKEAFGPAIEDVAKRVAQETVDSFAAKHGIPVVA